MSTIWIAQGAGSDNTPKQAGSLELLKLKHPSTGQPACFAVDEANKNFFEVNAGEHKYASWFLGNSVVSEGRLMMITRCDPLFVLLPVLETMQEKSIPMQNLLSDPELLRSFPGYSRLAKLLPVVNLAALCDVNDKYGPDMLLVKLNPSKVEAWMDAKYANVARVLKANCQSDTVQTSSSASSFTLPSMTKRVIEASSSEKSEQQNPDRSADREESLKRQALSFLSEYLPPPWMEKLLKRNDMTMDSLLSSKNSNVKKRGWNDTNSNDPLQYMHQQPIFQPETGVVAPKAAKKARTLAQRQLEKVDKRGMSALTSYFKKKPKKEEAK